MSEKNLDEFWSAKAVAQAIADEIKELIENYEELASKFDVSEEAQDEMAQGIALAYWAGFAHFWNDNVSTEVKKVSFEECKKKIFEYVVCKECSPHVAEKSFEFFVSWLQEQPDKTFEARWGKVSLSENGEIILLANPCNDKKMGDKPFFRQCADEIFLKIKN